MKQLKSGLYKASNVTFDPSTMEARSYQHWAFLKLINGKLVFNAHRYSVTTAKHQSKVRSLMVDLRMIPDVIVDTALSLDNNSALVDAKRNFLERIKTLNNNIDKKGSMRHMNEVRQFQIEFIMRELAKLENMGV